VNVGFVSIKAHAAITPKPQTKDLNKSWSAKSFRYTTIVTLEQDKEVAFKVRSVSLK
jgi:hypothetical protein